MAGSSCDDTSWDTAVRERISEAGCAEDLAREEVTLRWLHYGDYRPLLDWSQRRHAHSARVCRVVAAMIDLNYRCGDADDVRFEFRIEEVRTRGRPKSKVGEGSLGICLFQSMREHGVTKLAKGIDPGWDFWCALSKALVQGTSNRMWRRNAARTNFPLKAIVQKRPQSSDPESPKRAKGNFTNPELPMRDKVLGHMVKERIKKGDRYEDAVKAVFEQIEEMRQADGPRGPSQWDWTSKRTIEQAYKAFVRKHR
jgi:hypothetical protein